LPKKKGGWEGEGKEKYCHKWKSKGGRSRNIAIFTSKYTVSKKQNVLNSQSSILYNDKEVHLSKESNNFKYMFI
jgi:hypothetical protein